MSNNDLNDIEDMEVDQAVNNDNLQQSKPSKAPNNKEAEILDIDDIPDFEWENSFFYTFQTCWNEKTISASNCESSNHFSKT